MTPPLNWVGSILIENARRKKGETQFSNFLRGAFEKAWKQSICAEGLTNLEGPEHLNDVFKDDIVWTRRIVYWCMEGNRTVKDTVPGKCRTEKELCKVF